MIQIEKMNKVFHLKSGDVTALDNVTLNIGDGMIYGVIGYSGAGKSTLVRCLNLLETPDSGTLSVGDSGVRNLRRLLRIHLKKKTRAACSLILRLK